MSPVSLKPAQCRAARALLDWTQQQLAEHVGLSVVSIRAFEKGKDMRTSNQALLRLTLEKHGVQFIDENGGGAGARLRDREAASSGEGIKPDKLTSENDG
jgi:transcriptional regulator with XRE-family HTH domain